MVPRPLRPGCPRPEPRSAPMTSAAADHVSQRRDSPDRMFRVAAVIPVLVVRTKSATSRASSSPASSQRKCPPCTDVCGWPPAPGMCCCRLGFGGSESLKAVRKGLSKAPQHRPGRQVRLACGVVGGDGDEHRELPRAGLVAFAGYLEPRSVTTTPAQMVRSSTAPGIGPLPSLGARSARKSTQGNSAFSP